MNFVKKSLFAITILFLSAPAVNAMNDSASKDYVSKLPKLEFNFSTVKLSKSSTAVKYNAEGPIGSVKHDDLKTKAKKTKDKVVRIAKKHPTAVKVGVCTAITAAVVGGLYKYSSKFKKAVNGYVIEPVSNVSSKTKKIVGGTVCTAVVGVAGYFGYTKYIKKP